jgi:hypothetical protein
MNAGKWRRNMRNNQHWRVVPGPVQMAVGWNITLA